MAYNFTNLANEISRISDWLSREYDGIRTSRATPAVLDGVSVDAYGSKMPLKQVASISSQDSKTLYVSAYDPSLIKGIEKAISVANLGLSVGADEKGVRVSFPELTAERRETLIKLAKEKLEDARISVRKARDDVWGNIQEKEKGGEMAEDEKFKLKVELQRRVDEINKKLAEMAEKKEKEISS
ncbi:MAG: ribosome recycling factor [bacterium]|nr:ribosome recycling factor [bacterium]